MLFKNNNLDNIEVNMVSQIEVTESLVKIPNLNTALGELFMKAQPTKEERDKILILALELQKHANVLATWAAGN